MKVGDCAHLTGDLKPSPPTKLRYRLKKTEAGGKSRGAVGKKEGAWNESTKQENTGAESWRGWKCWRKRVSEDWDLHFVNVCLCFMELRGRQERKRDGRMHYGGPWWLSSPCSHEMVLWGIGVFGSQNAGQTEPVLKAEWQFLWKLTGKK